MATMRSGVFQPVFVKFMTHVAVKETLARHFVTFGKPQHLPAECGQATIERIKLINQILDLRAMELNAFDEAGQVFAEFLVFVFVRFREIVANRQCLDACRLDL